MTAEAPDVSIVIVAWQARDYVLACLRSIEAHAAPAHEVIVVDDGSTDGTSAAVAGGFPDVNLISQPENSGLVAGRNTAVAHVRGRYVLMLDADTELRPGALTRLRDVLDANPRVGLVAPRLVSAAGAVQSSARRFPPVIVPRGPFGSGLPAPQQRHLMVDFAHDEERPVVWVSGAVQMWRREFVESIGPYDTHISSYGGEDIDWCLRVWEAGYEVRFVGDAEMLHHWQNVVERRLWSRTALRAIRDYYYVVWKHRRLRKDPRLAAANA